MKAVPILQGRGLGKTYGCVTVVHGVDVDVCAGEVNAILGENGAGKSTLMKMLTGIVRPDAGTISVRGEEIQLTSPRRAADAGIAIVHQELHLAPMMSVCDNIMLVRPANAAGVKRGTRAERAYVSALLERVGLSVDPAMRVSALTTAECQLLEIAKAIAHDAQALVFDEPTSALLPAEAGRLLDLIERLREDGRAIFYISHALEEVMRIATRITVLRDGRKVDEIARAEFSQDRIIRAMIDRPLALYDHALPQMRDNTVFTAKNAASKTVSGLTFELKAGEILGFAGLVGSGMFEAGRLISGVDPLTGGDMMLDGELITFRDPAAAARSGVMLVPEERKQEGIAPDRSVCENLHLGRYHLYSRMGWIDRREMRHQTKVLIKKFDVRLSSQDQPIGTLSGGNQQKILLARAMQGDPKLIVIAAPTRGVDIGAKDAIHSFILDLAANGVAIILISSEMDEVIGLAHRIAVFSEGQMVNILDRAEASPENILRHAIMGVSNLENVCA